MKENLLITGALGQIGTALTQALRAKYGTDRVWATDIREPEHPAEGFRKLDVLDRESLSKLVEELEVTQIYHLAAILSAKGEQQPQRAWQINMDSLFNVLEVAASHQVRVFFPSSIAVFGTQTPPSLTPQHTVLDPRTVYGISKVAGEFWCQYYHEKRGLDVRSLRYPGIVGYESLPGGGTTDYAVEIFHKAVQGEPFTCFLRANTYLPMLYMPDAIRATIELMEAPGEQLTERTSYNLAGISFSPKELAEEIRRHLPDFRIEYRPDFRQDIADSWPGSIDDAEARRDWGWQARYGLSAMTLDMLRNLDKQGRDFAPARPVLPDRDFSA